MDIILLSPEPMHIPDGFLSVPVTIMLWVISIIVIAYALRRVNHELSERQVPLMGVLAAAIFAGQMLNFTVAGGTSGHLMGAALATIFLGPWAAILVMTTVVAVQALIFQDGGLFVLGANIFNMAIIGVMVANFIYVSILKVTGGKRWGIFTGGFQAAWFSIVIAALGVALQLSISGTSPANITIPAMGLIHMLIGLGEGLITTGAIAVVLPTRPDLLRKSHGSSANDLLVLGFGLSLALTLAILSPLASIHPDGLEWVAEQQGFLDSAQSPAYTIIPDYILPGISNEVVATMAAGIVGVLIVFGIILSVGRSHRIRGNPS